MKWSVGERRCGGGVNPCTCDPGDPPDAGPDMTAEGHPLPWQCPDGGGRSARFTPTTTTHPGSSAETAFWTGAGAAPSGTRTAPPSPSRPGRYSLRDGKDAVNGALTGYASRPGRSQGFPRLRGPTMTAPRYFGDRPMPPEFVDDVAGRARHQAYGYCGHRLTGPLTRLGPYCRRLSTTVAVGFEEGGWSGCTRTCSCCATRTPTSWNGRRPDSPPSRSCPGTFPQLQRVQSDRQCLHSGGKDTGEGRVTSAGRPTKLTPPPHTRPDVGLCRVHHHPVIHM